VTRAVSTGLQAELDKTVTRIGYLLQINGSEIRRWSNLGDTTYLAVPWAGVDFDISGLRWDTDRDPDCTLKVSNLDSAVAAWFMLEQLQDVTVDIYQFAPAALADGDASYLAKFVFDSCQIKLDVLEARLVAYSSLYAYSPRRRVDSSNGFNFALPKGTQVTWGNEVYIVEPENG
jgi:hypothetical protein